MKYSKLTPENYRIIKSIGIDKKDRSYETFYVSAEFIIKQWIIIKILIKNS